jgi:hypothetical protein
MAKIVIGEIVINKLGTKGTIVSFDDKYISVDYGVRIAKLQANAFEEGFLKYENEDLQRDVAECINKVNLEKQKKAEEERITREIGKGIERQQLPKTHKIGDYNIIYESVAVRLDPAPVYLSSVKKRDRELVQEIFKQCDEDIKDLYNQFNPKMNYSKYTSRSRSKYAVGFLCKYANTYVFRVFSRNDIFKNRIRTGVTVMESDTTEIFRILCIKGITYYFSKNLAYSENYFNNTTAYQNWHATNLCRGVLLNEIIKRCDCGYLNNYIEERQINCEQYVKLLMPAFYNNKVEIVFKNKLFLSAYRIENIVDYLEEFSSKQVDFASKNNVINALPMIKKYGLRDVELLQKLEEVMKDRGWRSGCTYSLLKRIFEEKNFDSSQLDKQLIGFLKKVDNFDVSLYNDYLNKIRTRQWTTEADCFDKNYIQRYAVILQEESVTKDARTPEMKKQYAQVAKQLSWIDREENGYYIIVPKTIEDFQFEGDVQHICVYSARYYERVIDRSSIIVFLRENEYIPFVTIEYDYETFELLQARMKYNASVSKELRKYIIDLGKQLYFEKHTLD